jgi:hypothetical protein
MLRVCLFLKSGVAVRLFRWIGILLSKRLPFSKKRLLRWRGWGGKHSISSYFLDISGLFAVVLEAWFTISCFSWRTTFIDIFSIVTSLTSLARGSTSEKRPLSLLSSTFSCSFFQYAANSLIWIQKPGLGLTLYLFCLTNSKLLAGSHPITLIRYATTIAPDLETPAWQCTSTFLFYFLLS